MKRAIAVGVASCRYGGGAASKGGDPWFGPVLLPQIHEPRSAKIMGHNIYIALHSSVVLSLLIAFIWFLLLITSSACPASHLAHAWCTDPRCRRLVHIAEAVGKLLLTFSGPW